MIVRTQILSFIGYSIMGIVTYLNYFYIYKYKKKYKLSYLFNLLIILSFLYLFWKINNGRIHIYYIFVYFISMFISKICVNKIKIK